MTRALTIAACACALAFAACGQSDEDQVKEALTGYEAAVNAKQYKKICDDYISAQLRKAAEKSVSSKSCAAALKEQDKVSGVSGKYKLEVGKVEVDGDKATAEVNASRAGRRTKAKFKLTKDGDQWKIAGLSL